MNGKDSARSPFFCPDLPDSGFRERIFPGPGWRQKGPGFFRNRPPRDRKGGRDPAAADYSCESTRSSIDAPDHWLIRRFSERMRWPSQAIFRSISKGRVASMSLPAGSVWGTM